MKPLNRLILALVTVFYAISAPSLSFGRDKAGNGGDAVVCRDDNKQIRSAELLDYYEGRVLRDMKLDLGVPTLSFQEKLEIAMKRLDRISPIRASQYRDEIESFMSNVRFLSGNPLVLIPDAEPVSFPAGCGIEQLAVQKTPEFPGDKLYTIDKDIWDKLDNDSRAGLILHEIIYNEALSYDHENSVNVRYLNSVIASPPSLNLVRTQEQIFDLMTLIHFSVTDFYGIRFLLSSSGENVRFYANGNFRSASVAFPGKDKVVIQSQSLTVNSIEFYEDGAVAFVNFDSGKFLNRPTNEEYTSRVSFFPNGKLSGGIPYQHKIIHPVSHLVLGGFVSYDENGTITSAWMGDQTFQGKNFELIGEPGHVNLFPNGFPMSATYIVAPRSWIDIENHEIDLDRKSCKNSFDWVIPCKFVFNSEGYVISIEGLKGR